MNNLTARPNTHHSLRKPAARIEPAPVRPGPPQALHTNAHNLHRMETIAEHFTVAGSSSPRSRAGVPVTLVVLAEH